MGSMPIWHLPGARHPVLGAGYSALKARQGIANPMLKSVQKIFATLRVDEDPIGTSFTCLVVWMDGDTLVARLQSYSLAVYLTKGSSSMGESMYFLYKKTVCYYLRVGIISLTTQISLRYLCFWRSIDFFAIIYDLAGIKIPSGYLYFWTCKSPQEVANNWKNHSSCGATLDRIKYSPSVGDQKNYKEKIGKHDFVYIPQIGIKVDRKTVDRTQDVLVPSRPAKVQRPSPLSPYFGDNGYGNSHQREPSFDLAKPTISLRLLS
jgi:hypothetical protein